MTGMRLRDLMLAAGLMALVVVSISMQLSMAGQMTKTGAAATTALVAAAE